MILYYHINFILKISLFSPCFLLFIFLSRP
nr:MAG TPA: hypothetical protein [Caudoviricetes sp.]DAR23599.1 MAG TPA: hypothetical protein [Caudoviricetes sp.]